MTTETRAPKILDGKATAQQIRSEVAEGCARLREQHGIAPGLTVVLIGEDPASQIYVRNKEKMARKAGMESRIERLPETTSQDELLQVVGRLNDDPAVHGILVQLPLPAGIDEHRIIEALDPRKDVDGFHPDNSGRLLTGLPGFVPCTPAGIVELLKRNDIALSGRRAVIIGRSNIVGKPMAVLLLRENCTVTVCHSRTVDLPQVAATGDILIAAVGRMGMVTGEFVKPGAAVVDVGHSSGGRRGDLPPTVRRRRGPVGRGSREGWDARRRREPARGPGQGGLADAGAGRGRSTDDRHAAQEHAGRGRTVGRLNHRR